MSVSRQIIFVFHTEDMQVLLGKISLFALKICKLKCKVRLKAFSKCLSWFVALSAVVTQVPISF